MTEIDVLIRKLDVQPDDLIVLEVPHALTDEQLRVLRDTWAHVGAGVRAIVLEVGRVELSVVRDRDSIRAAWRAGEPLT